MRPSEKIYCERRRVKDRILKNSNISGNRHRKKKKQKRNDKTFFKKGKTENEVMKVFQREIIRDVEYYRGIEKIKTKSILLDLAINVTGVIN